MIPDIVEIKRLCASGQWLARIENGKILLHDTVAGETVCIGQTDAEPVRHAENVTPTHPSDMFICGDCGFVCEITKLIYKDEDHPEVGPPEAFEYECEYCPHCGSKMDAKEA